MMEGGSARGSESGAKESKTKMKQRHRVEWKELKVKTESLQKNAKKDKQAKAEVAIKIKRMEDELQRRHDAEELACTNDGETEQSALEVQTANLTLAPAPSTNKRAGKKRQQKNLQLKQEHDRIKALDEESKNVVSSRTIENNALMSKLGPLGLSIKEIPPDGNCLYNAIADQISLQRGLKESCTSLRNLAADHMLSHPDDFLPFLQVEADEPSIRDLEKYCDELRSTNNWGGQLEIMALCHSLSTPITVYSVDQPDVIMGEEYSSKQSPVKLTYHKHAYALGEHYNSVVPAEDPASEQGVDTIDDL